jgi:hypothetical protein
LSTLVGLAVSAELILIYRWVLKRHYGPPAAAAYRGRIG